MHVSIILIYMTKYITKLDNDGRYISPLESSRIKYIGENIMNISNRTFECEWINGQKTGMTVFNCLQGLDMEYAIGSEEKNLCEILGME